MWFLEFSTSTTSGAVFVVDNPFASRAVGMEKEEDEKKSMVD